MDPEDTSIADRRWFVSVQGQRMGPYSGPALEEWLGSGRFPPQALLSCGGPWMTVAQYQAEGRSGDTATGEVIAVSPLRRLADSPFPDVSLPALSPIRPPAAGEEGIVPRADEQGGERSGLSASRETGSAGASPSRGSETANRRIGEGEGERIGESANRRIGEGESGGVFRDAEPAVRGTQTSACAEAHPTSGLGIETSACAEAHPTSGLDAQDSGLRTTHVRDRIVILGRRQSGKTIFLASTYARLWQSLNGMTAKAISGQVHKQLMTVHQMLAEGQWPASTLGTLEVDLELEHEGRRRRLVTMDFAGELFAKAFLDEQSDWPGVRALVNHIDQAAAVMLLVDPSVVAGLDKQAAMEDDFGLVQAVQRIRHWPGGELVPIVLVLTKIDQHQALVDRVGGPLEFVRKYFPALVRLLRQIPIVQISAVQVEADPSGKLRPRLDSSPVNLDTPLLYCLREIDRAEQQAELRQRQEQARAMESRLAIQQQQEQRRNNVLTALAIAIMSLLGLAVLGLILYFQV